MSYEAEHARSDAVHMTMNGQRLTYVIEDECWQWPNETGPELFTVAELLDAHTNYLAARYRATCQTPDQAQPEHDQTQTESGGHTSDT